MRAAATSGRSVLAIAVTAFLGAPLLGAKPPAAAAAPAAPPPAEAEAKAAPPPEAEASPPTYVYEVRGRRDPFRSLLIRKQNETDRAKPPGIAGMLVEEIELQGTIKVKGTWIAQVRGGDNRSYLLRKGNTVFDGEVLEITPTEIVLRQNVSDPTSPKPFRDVVKSLALQKNP